MNILEAYLANSLDLLKFFGVLGYLSAYTVGAAASALYDLAAKNDQDKKEVEETDDQDGKKDKYFNVWRGV